ncbi:immunoglobulin-like domain-containing protein [Paenibacillus allorhizosphaerae]|uniref:Bacterial Ig-like domain-containing protein n=1 Tax=Paenibacillus allorhizosphaerae TaxID=2849866 RepID=A0ABN7U057_9BACL|nr:immunoglobulin-like domain-containing protein [Paenibacillus allorhizosphaerae]CAG7659062.1 hypothetical protein PAECIP111802_07313 [Paenibacillus allorhizosphaerae]
MLRTGTILLFMLVTACNSNPIPGSPDATVSSAKLTPAPSLPGNPPTQSLDMLIGYGPQTGAWFLSGGQGQGRIGFGIAAGKSKPGSEISVRLDARPLNRDVRVRLSKLDEQRKPVSVIEERLIRRPDSDSSPRPELVVTMRLPEDTAITYLMSVEIIGDEDNVEDTLLSTVEVPVQELVAKLYADKNQFRSDETMVLKLTNEGRTDISLGMEYWIETERNGAWEKVPLTLAFIAIGYIHPPGSTFQQSVPLSKLKKGRYRIVKEVHADGTSLRNPVSFEFDIVD